MEKAIAIHGEDLTISYGASPVIWDVDFDIYSASKTAIVGPNGAGKSTLLKGILGLIKPISGQILIYDKPYKEVIKRVSYVPQSGSVNWDFPATVLDVVLMGRYVHLGWIKRPRAEDKTIAKNALEQMGMLEYAGRHISQLSGGQKQRVFLARAIAQQADLYILDEPLAGVDIKTEAFIMKILTEFRNQGKTVVVVHHDLNTVEQYFDNIVLINKQILGAGSVAEVFNEENIEKAYGIADRKRVG